MRNTGTKNAASTDTYTTADRVVVIAGSSTVQGDLNGDSSVNVFDLSLLLSKWGSADATADINHSGKVDVFDLSVLLSGWTKLATPAPM